MNVGGVGGRPPALGKKALLTVLGICWLFHPLSEGLGECEQTFFGVIVTTVCIFPSNQERC